MRRTSTQEEYSIARSLVDVVPILTGDSTDDHAVVHISTNHRRRLM